MSDYDDYDPMDGDGRYSVRTYGDIESALESTTRETQPPTALVHTRNFSYKQASGSLNGLPLKHDDGLMIVVPSGVLISMFESEEAYFVTWHGGKHITIAITCSSVSSGIKHRAFVAGDRTVDGPLEQSVRFTLRRLVHVLAHSEEIRVIDEESERAIGDMLFDLLFKDADGTLLL